MDKIFKPPFIVRQLGKHALRHHSESSGYSLVFEMGKRTTATNYHAHKPNGQSYLGQTTRDTYTSSGAQAGRFASHEAARWTSITPYATYSSDSKASAKAVGEARESHGIGGGYDGTNYFHTKGNYTRGNNADKYYGAKADTGQGAATTPPHRSRSITAKVSYVVQ